MIHVAVLGYGTVGSGVLEVFRMNQEKIDRCAGDQVRIKYILDLRDFPGDPAQELIVHDFEQIINDVSIDIVVEVMGGLDPAYTFVKRSLEAGKNVVTSNKALVAAHGSELLQTAKEHHVNYLFEASVGGGIPIIRPLVSSLTADEIEEITGILNGTTNYMMTKMFYEGADYDEALREAQANGYAERNPEADVEGRDACRKIAILSSIVSGRQVDFEDIYTEGITKITAQDMRYAKEMNMVIKLLATMKQEDGTIGAIVAPFYFTQSIRLQASMVCSMRSRTGQCPGRLHVLWQRGRQDATASAVTADIVEAARYQDRTICEYWSGNKMELKSRMDVKRKFFIRMAGRKEAYADRIREAFGEVQYLTADGCEGEFAFVTGEIKEGKYESAAAEFGNLIHMIRVAS